VDMAEIERRAREIVSDLVPGGVETIEGGDYGIGRAAGYKGLVFVITPTKAGVRLGFPGGATLPDPHGLLEGRGKVHRFVRITDPAELDRPELQELLRAQAAAR
jgi:hypothetical protein